MSVFYDIPGGRAELFERDELTARRQLPGKMILNANAALIQRVTVAAVVKSPKGELELNPGLVTEEEFHLSEADMLVLERLQCATTWARLKSWTLDRVLPATPDDLLDLQPAVYETLKAACQEQQGKESGTVADLFEPSDTSLEDTESPFGNSGTLPKSSPAKKPPSTKKRPGTGGNGSAAKRSAGRTTST